MEGFWSELGVVRGLWSDPWCLAGNFHMIRFSSERGRGGRLSLHYREICLLGAVVLIIGTNRELIISLFLKIGNFTFRELFSLLLLGWFQTTSRFFLKGEG